VGSIELGSTRASLYLARQEPKDCYLMLDAEGLLVQVLRDSWVAVMFELGPLHEVCLVLRGVKKLR
jgi:hypothetical protein